MGLAYTFCPCLRVRYVGVIPLFLERKGGVSQVAYQWPVEENVRTIKRKQNTKKKKNKWQEAIVILLNLTKYIIKFIVKTPTLCSFNHL